ncbi:MAG: radical SAM protein [Bacteriovorax sp.]|jgi:heme d1 biosynthesis radical SAM protein NirJ|nr:radical SAM protein [Bacteriovorax sp.]
MFRLSHYMSELLQPKTFTRRKAKGPVVIWNLLRRCNLSCRHCYANSFDKEFEGELRLDECLRTVDQLKEAHVPALILSGGEPLLHPHLFTIAKYAKEKKFYLALSSNGILITEEVADRLKDLDFNYVGVSLDGLPETHDYIRGQEGAFHQSVEGIKNGVSRGLKMGMRTTLTHSNAHQIEAMLDLAISLGVEKFYLSHLNYGGRGNKKEDALFKMTRDVMILLFEKALEYESRGIHLEIVTGNNDADAAFMLMWAEEKVKLGLISQTHLDHVAGMLEFWGGNASGVGVANIDSQGDVHPDTFWPGVQLGNLRQNSFGDIWSNNEHPIIKVLRSDRTAITGRCHDCQFFKVCNGNTRVRAHKTFNDPWASDPGCYLTDAEIKKINILSTNNDYQLNPIA